MNLKKSPKGELISVEILLFTNKINEVLLDTRFKKLVIITMKNKKR